MSKFKNILLLCLFSFLCATLCYAQNINFETTVDSHQVSLGSSLRLNLSFYGMKDVSAPELPDIDGFDWRYLGPSTRISMVNGKVSSSITHIYTLIPLKVGKFKIPSFSVNYKGKTYTSKSIPVEVIRGTVSQPQGKREEITEDKIKALDDRIFLTMQIGKRKAYVNEIIPLKIKLYISQVTIRDIQTPEFAHEGFLVDEFADPKQYREVLHGIQYDVIELDTNIFGMRPGQLTLGPAELRCNLIVRKKSGKRPSSFFFDEDFFRSDIFDDFFTRYERHPLKLASTPITITIMDLPEKNRPVNFSGALGNYGFSLEASPAEVKVGDPITLKMTVSGEGNFNTVKAPELPAKNNFKVYEPEIKQSEWGKTFEQIIIPRNTRIKEIPEITFNFFDTQTGEYKKITRGPIPITVNPLPEGEELKVFELPEKGEVTARKREILGQDIIYIKDNPGRLRPEDEFLCQNPLFIILQFIPLLAVISVLIFQRRRNRLRNDIRYARRLRAPRKAKKNLLMVRRLIDSKETGSFFDAVFRTLKEYLGDKFHLPTAGITSNVIEELSRYNINKEILDKIKECFDVCDSARYAPSKITAEDMSKTLRLLEEIIDKLEKVKT